MRRGIGASRALGLVMGLAIALTAVRAWALPPGQGELGTDLIMATAPTGELAVSVTGPFLTGTGMRPGAQADGPSGRFDVYNRTAATLAIQVKAQPSRPDLDDLLWVEVDAAGDRVYRGALSGLTEGSPGSFRLAPTQTVTLSVRAWLPTDVKAGYQGRVVTVDLTFVPTPVEGSG